MCPMFTAREDIEKDSDRRGVLRPLRTLEFTATYNKKPICIYNTLKNSGRRFVASCNCCFLRD